MWRKKPDNNLILINSNGKQVQLSEDDDLVIEHDTNLNVNENFKDDLLASLCAQVEFLRKELEENNFLIHSLIIREGDVYNYTPSNKSDGDISVTSYSTYNNSVADNIHENDTDNMNIINPSIVRDEDEDDFNSLYLQYLRDMRELEEISITNQLITILCGSA